MYHGLKFTHYPTLHTSYATALSDGSHLAITFEDDAIILCRHDSKSNRLDLPLAHAILILNQFLPVKVWTKSSFTRENNLWSIEI